MTVVLPEQVVSYERWTRVHERLRAFTSVWVMSGLHFMRFTQWAEMRGLPTQAGPLERLRELHKSWARGTRAKTLQTVSWRVWEGLGVCFAFFPAIVFLRFCISLAVIGSQSRFQQPRHDSHGRQTHAGQLAVGGRESCPDG